MNNKRRQTLLVINLVLVGVGLLGCLFLNQRIDGWQVPELKRYRAAIQNTDNTEWLRRKLIVSNHYTATLEELANASHNMLQASCAALAVAAALNLVLGWHKNGRRTETL